MVVLKSIKDVLDIYGAKCKECDQISNGIYDAIRRDGDNVFFDCSRFPGGHRLRAAVGFETSKEEIEELGTGIVNFVKTNSSDLTEWKIRDVRQELSKLNRKLAVYAKFLPEDSVIWFDGYCSICLREAPLHIENQNIYCGCETCASAMADSVD